MKLPIFVLLITLIIGCSPSRVINRSARSLASSPALHDAHIGISVYDAEAGRYIGNYQGDKYFVPASNTKLATCYAAMKYLGDSLEGIHYVRENDSVITLFPTGDPSFLHEDFKRQPVRNLLRQEGQKFYLSDVEWQEDALGSGWTWNDYTASYMAERSGLPIEGNLAKFTIEEAHGGVEAMVEPSYFSNVLDTLMANLPRYPSFTISRPFGSNAFFVAPGRTRDFHAYIPFVTYGDSTAVEILKHNYSIDIKLNNTPHSNSRPEVVIHSQPTDSILKPMMHRSDNFFAEQMLLMVSSKMLHVMNDARVTDTLLRSDLSFLPQKPRWVDGSGLSRYNLFTPQDFVSILDHMRREFGVERMKNILPAGNEGTLSNYYVAEHEALWAKTGTLSGVVSISGIVYTKKNRLLIFSILVNNNRASATEVRRAVEGFVKELRER